MGRRYPVTDAVVETPRYTGMAAEGVGGREHDLLGHGWVEVDGGTLVVAIAADGVVGHLEPKEKRRFALSAMTGWRVTGSLLEFAVGSLGLFATNGAAAPNHLGTVHLASAGDAEDLTREACEAGLTVEWQPPSHGGL